MLRLTVTVFQVMSDAHVIASVYQEDPLAPSVLLGEAKTVYDLSDAIDRWDELTALISVLGDWATQVNVDKS